MDLNQHYQWLYENSFRQIRAGTHRTDSFLDSRVDGRRGLTLIIRPPENIIQTVNFFLKELQKTEPEQYYQPESDMHVTVLSIFNCADGFLLDQIPVEEYINVIKPCFIGQKSLKISFKGVTTAMDGVMIKGYFDGESLNLLRDSLREAFKRSGLGNDIDSRYRIDAAHMTVVRFRKPLVRSEEFLETLERYKNFNFGEFSVREVEFVFNNWYVTKKYVHLLKRFPLS